MVPNKFEKHIKEKLDGREIKPSAKTWQKLNNQLDASSIQPKKKGYFWYGIAASFIGILIVSILYMNRENAQITTDIQVVDSFEEENKETNDFKTDILIEDTTEIKVAETTTNAIQNNIKKESIKDTKQENLVTDMEDKIVSFEKEASAIEEVQIKSKLSDQIINTKILEIVAQVNSLEENTNALTDAEVDSLLRNAQEEILRDKLFNQNRSVDAMALLIEVEDELDRSFRDQIFESLKTGFLKVRTAVADRNK